MPLTRPFRDELDALYRQVLGRPLDHSGYFTYANLLERGKTSLADVERILRASREGREHAEARRAR